MIVVISRCSLCSTTFCALEGTALCDGFLVLQDESTTVNDRGKMRDSRVPSPGMGPESNSSGHTALLFIPVVLVVEALSGVFVHYPLSHILT